MSDYEIARLKKRVTKLMSDSSRITKLERKVEKLTEQVALLVKDSHKQPSMEKMVSHAVKLVRAVEREDSVSPKTVVRRISDKVGKPKC
jgi:hypothetical protein